jgi:hypothetical protein
MEPKFPHSDPYCKRYTLNPKKFKNLKIPPKPTASVENCGLKRAITFGWKRSRPREWYRWKEGKKSVKIVKKTHR